MPTDFDVMDRSMFGSANSAPHLHHNQHDGLTGILDDLTQEMFLTIQVPSVNEACNDSLDLNFEMDQPTEITTNNNNKQQNNAACCCKTIQKVLNKINYVHKTVSKELSVVRQEVGQNRKLLLQLLNTKEASEEHTEENPNVTEAIQDEPAQLNVVEID